MVPRRRVHRAPHPRVRPLERGRRWSTAPTTASTASAVTSPRTRRRPRSTRSASTTSSAARATAASATRCTSRVTPRRASTPARSSRAASPRTSSTTSAARSAGRGLPSYPHPRRLPDVLGVPDGLDGARPDQRGVPGALQPLPLQPQARRHLERARVVLRRRRRDGRARGDGRARPRGARTARQPDLRRQLQPAAARRSGARQRQGHPGVRVDVPRHGLERDQGHLGPAAGTSCSPATSTACSSTR